MIALQNSQQSEMSTWKLINSSRKPGLPTLHCPLPIPHTINAGAVAVGKRPQEHTHTNRPKYWPNEIMEFI